MALKINFMLIINWLHAKELKGNRIKQQSNESHDINIKDLFSQK